MDQDATACKDTPLGRSYMNPAAREVRSEGVPVRYKRPARERQTLKERSAGRGGGGRSGGTRGWMAC